MQQRHVLDVLIWAALNLLVLVVIKDSVFANLHVTVSPLGTSNLNEE